MEDVRDLKALQLDALKEVANIGAGQPPPRSRSSRTGAS